MTLEQYLKKIPEFKGANWLLRIPVAVVFILQGLQKLPLDPAEADMWGEKWFMLINPMYGQWEEVLYEYCWECYPKQSDKIKQRLKALE